MIFFGLSVPKLTWAPGDKKQNNPCIYHSGRITSMDVLIFANVKLRCMTETESDADLNSIHLYHALVANPSSGFKHKRIAEARKGIEYKL